MSTTLRWPVLRWPTSVTAKLSFSRQNFLSHGKTFFLTAKLSFSRQLFHFTIKFHNFTNRRGRVVNMAAEEDRMDDLYKKSFSRGLHTEKYACFLEEITSVSLALSLLKGKPNNLVSVGECHVITSML